MRLCQPLAVTCASSRGKRAALLFILLVFAGLSGCDHNPFGEESAVVGSLGVFPSTGTVNEGATLQFQTVVRGPRGFVLSDWQVEWQSSNPNLAHVSGEGVVTGKLEGEVDIVATTHGKSAKARVLVVRPPVDSIILSPPATELVVHDSLSLQAELRDPLGNVLTGRTVAWESSDSAVARVNDSGMVSAILPGAAVIRARSEGKIAESHITVTPGPPAALVILAGDQQVAEVMTTVNDSLEIRVTDADGNPVPEVEITWAAADSGAVILGTGITDANGAAKASWTLGPRSGSQHASASAAALTADFTASAAPGRPGSPTLLDGDRQQAPVSTTLPAPLRVLLRDAHGNATPGITVTWRVINGGGSVNAGTTPTDSVGHAAVSWTLGPGAGEQTAAATLPDVGEVTFRATALAGPPLTPILLDGDGQEAMVSTLLPAPLRVRLQDARGNPTPGVTVEWRVTGGGGRLSAAATLSDAAGLASVAWTLGSAIGAQTATATVAGAGSLSFRATGLKAPEAFTSSATGVTSFAAVLRGTANPNGSLTEAFFEWGTSANLQTFAATATRSIGSGTAGVDLSQSLAGLTPGTTYYFRSVASSRVGTARSAIRSFTTPTLETVRIVTFGDSNTDTGYSGNNSAPRAQSYISAALPRPSPDQPHSAMQLAGKVEAAWRQIRMETIIAVNHGIGGTSTGGGAGGGVDRTLLGAPNARTVVNGVTRFEAEALGTGYPWHGGEPSNSSFPEGPISRVNAYRPRTNDFLYVSMGTNDLIQEIPASQTLANLEWMVDRWVAGGGRAQHLIITTLPPRTSSFGSDIPIINDGIRILAASRGVHLIDLAAHTSADNGVSWRGPDYNVGDGLHYSEQVRDWLAARIVEYMDGRVSITAASGAGGQAAVQ